MNFKTMICISAMTLSAGQAFSQVDTCGTSGDLKTRIEDCGQVTNGFALVAKTQDHKEVYMELKTGLIWSETISQQMNYEMATTACKSTIAEVAGLSNYEWKLPTIEEFQSADESGFRMLPGVPSGWFLSSSQGTKDYWAAKMFVGADGDIYEAHRHYDGFGSVKCVAQAK